MAKVKFNETVATREARPQRFEAGRVYDLPEASADRWVVRGKADRVDDDAGGPASPEPPPAKPAAGPAAPGTPNPPGRLPAPTRTPPAEVLGREKPARPAAKKAVAEPPAPRETAAAADGAEADPETPEA